MVSYLVDTTVFVDHYRGLTEATTFLDRNDLILSVVTVAELVQGAKDKSALEKISKLPQKFEVDWGEQKIGRLAIDILTKYCLGKGVRFIDAYIAATAIVRKLTLVTENVKHFKYIPGLRVVRMKDVE